MDLFLRGFVKNCVYQTEVTTAVDMKARIREAFRAITIDMLGAVGNSFLRRLQICDDQNGGHFEQLL